MCDIYSTERAARLRVNVRVKVGERQKRRVRVRRGAGFVDAEAAGWSDPAEQPTEDADARTAWRRWLIGTVLAGLALLFTATGPVRDLLTDRTATNLFRAELATVNADAARSFVVPADAPLEEFPGEFRPGCTEDGLRWLRRHGQERRSLYVDIRNVAQDGPQLNLDNVRVVGKDTTDVAPAVLVLCDSAGVGDVATLRLDLTHDRPAVLVDDASGQTRPFAFNLAPGEQGALVIRFSGSDKTYSGRLVADVSVGDATEQVTLPTPDGEGHFDVPGLGRSAGFIATPTGPGTFMCTGDDGETTECSAAFIRAAIAQRWEQPDIAADVLDSVSRRSSCGRPASDAEQWSEAWSGYLGNLNIYAIDQAAREQLVVRPIERMMQRCGQDYTMRVIGGVGLSEVDRRSALHVVSPGNTPSDGDSGITSVMAVVDASNCADAAADANSLGELWAELLGASWVDHPRFHELAYQPMARLGERCGSEHAANVIYEIGLTGATYRALDDAVSDHRNLTSVITEK